MKTSSRRKIAGKVALRSLLASQGTSLSAVLQLGTSQSRVALEQLEGVLEKAVLLINDSNQKEHIYSEAGDLITSTRETMERLREGLAVLSYVSSRIDQRKLKNKIPAHVKGWIDDLVKKDK